MSEAGYCGKPLASKLGAKAGMRWCVVDAPLGYGDWLGALSEMPAMVQAKTGDPVRGPFDLIHLFVANRAALEAGAPRLLSALVEGGALWASWPKKTSPLFVDLTEDGIRAVALPLGLVDVKVCAVTQDWSGLKLMRRKKKD